MSLLWKSFFAFCHPFCTDPTHLVSGFFFRAPSFFLLTPQRSHRAGGLSDGAGNRQVCVPLTGKDNSEMGTALLMSISSAHLNECVRMYVVMRHRGISRSQHLIHKMFYSDPTLFCSFTLRIYFADFIFNHSKFPLKELR